MEIVTNNCNGSGGCSIQKVELPIGIVKDIKSVKSLPKAA